MKKKNENEREDKTMEREKEEKKRPFSGGSITDDLIDWAGKLKALGEVWGTLSWHESRGDFTSETLTECGEALGRIIMDYAELIETTVTENHLQRSPLSRYEEVLKSIEDSKGGGGSAGVIGCEIGSIDDFIKTVALPAFDLKKRFEELQKKYPVRQKSAPTAEAAGA